MVRKKLLTKIFLFEFGCWQLYQKLIPVLAIRRLQGFFSILDIAAPTRRQSSLYKKPFDKDKCAHREFDAEGSYCKVSI